ncbi:lipopolysaccharide biosynthesis protein [Blastococcus mobilis]|uniref:Membrane protein involved in the export of O-antigen and teichoic acid n=1 Tax=Blastococcus mobilis TaxID=1938746 RepID=A0A238W4Z6_9ACTN|nr:oligosaccharide flippase family protein [Blastococcus mobilis]SNR41394.1 Membrane protein involved in the export of O-antigen and teichoic acid [Blastococcus mobilis]
MSAGAVRTADPAVEAGRSTVWRGMARGAGSRLVVLPVSALLGIVLTRLVIENYGRDAFAQYGLLVGIGALLPFADLGISAAVMNAVGAAPRPGQDDHVWRVLVTAFRVLLGSAAVLALVAVTLTVSGLWPTLLGAGLLPGSGPPVAMTCLLLIAAAMPVGIGQRVLAGLGRNHVSILVLGAQTPLVLGTVLVLMWWDVPIGPAVAVVAYAATLLLSVLLTVLAGRELRPALGRALRDVPRWRTVRGARVFDVAWPMLVQMIALPIAMQTDRIVLSHRADAGALAEYTLAAQMFTPIWAVVSAAGVTLWPVYARARARGRQSSPVPMAGLFGGLAALMAGGVALASSWLAELASGGRILLGCPLVAAFALLMVLQGVKYPLGMFMTDSAGLRFQALMIVLMLPVNVGLSWYLAGSLGAVGPVIGSVIGVAGSQVLANLLYVRRKLRRTDGPAR